MEMKYHRSSPLMITAAFWRFVLFVVLYLSSLATALSFQLVTEREAALPDDLMGVTRGGLTRAPEVIIVSPSPEAGSMTSPLRLKVKFKAHGGATIDYESILVTYRKIPAIDITQRIRPFIHAGTIEIGSAELPPGVHRFKIDVRDSEGRKGTELLLISIEK